MSKRNKVIVLAGVAVLLIFGIIAGILLDPSERPLKDPMAFYDTVCGQLAALESHTYEVVFQTTTKIQDQVFEEATALTVQQQAVDGQATLTVAKRNVSMGGFQFSSLERLEDATLYIDLNGSRFHGEAIKELAYPPELLLNAKHYSQITGTRQGDEITIAFTEPAAAEEWAMPEGAILQNACGTLKATKDGTLVKTSYSITYQHGQCEVMQTINCVPSQEELDTSAFDKSAYAAIENIEAPVLLERMSGYLLQSQKIGASYREYIYCQTFGDQRTRDMRLEMNNGSPFYAELTTNAALTNSSRGESSSSVLQTETFQNGTYTRQSSGTDPITDETITEDRFRKHCNDILVGTILLPQFISSTTKEEDDSSITYHFTPTEELAGLLCEEASQNLYQDPTVLSSLASNSATEVLSAYLQIDKATGLPLSSGIHCKGIYTITELPYRLEYTTDQTYSFSADDKA